MARWFEPAAELLMVTQPLQVYDFASVLEHSMTHRGRIHGFHLGQVRRGSFEF